MTFKIIIFTFSDDDTVAKIYYIYVYGVYLQKNLINLY